MLDSTQRTTAAELLWAAERDLAPIDPLTETYPGIDVVDAYEIQLINIRRRIAAGARVRGHKVGLSSPVMQQMMGVDEPDYGHLLDAMVLGQDAPIPAGRYCYPRIEVEIGYVLGVRPARRGLHRGRRAGRHRVHRAEPGADRQPDQGLADQAGRHHRRQRVLGRGHPRARPAGRPPSWRPRASTWRTSTRCCTPATGGKEDRPRQHQRRARQPDRLRRLAGQQGGRLRGEARGRAPHPPRVVHPGDRRAPGHQRSAPSSPGSAP